jgi:hypothetical protein
MESRWTPGRCSRAGVVGAGLLLIALVPVVIVGAEPSPSPVLTVRLTHPEVQGGRLIDLFKGSRAPHPAAALAAWKHATKGRSGLGKRLEALIATINPQMVRESRLLDGAEFRLALLPGTGQPRWRVVVPHDDGSIAALVTALALTDGATLEPIEGFPVFRLGPPGAPTASSRPGLLAIASDLEELTPAIATVPAGDEAQAQADSGMRLRLVPEGLRAARSLTVRRAFEALDAFGCRDVEGRLAFADDDLSLELDTRLDDAPRVRNALDPSWLDAVTGPGVVAAAALVVDLDGKGLDAAFALADRVEKADPARAGVAPLRTRLNLVATAARVLPEADLWPHLRGLSGGVFVGADGRVSGAIVGLHASGPDASSKIATVVLPRLAATYLGPKRQPREAIAELDGVIPLGTIAGRPLGATVRASSVWVGWGDRALADALEASAHPERSAVRALVQDVGAHPPQRAGVFWPGRSPGFAPPGSPLAGALTDAPPVVWLGHTDGPAARDVVRWTGLRGVIRRWLDALPLEPPPDRASPG